MRRWTKREQHPQTRVLYAPDGAGYGLPLPVHQVEDQTGEQHEGASLHGFGDDPRPPVFEALTGHDAVLNREEHQQGSVDRDGTSDTLFGFAPRVRCPVPGI